MKAVNFMDWWLAYIAKPIRVDLGHRQRGTPKRKHRAVRHEQDHYDVAHLRRQAFK